MKKLNFLFSLVLFSCFNFVSAEELTQFYADDPISTPMYQYKQVNLIRISPDDNAPFVEMEVPDGHTPIYPIVFHLNHHDYFGVHLFGSCF